MEKPLENNKNFILVYNVCQSNITCDRTAIFTLAGTVILVWMVTGPLFNFSDTWQLVINTGTTIVTFLMVFLIQNTQNRDSEAMQIKLDEIIRSIDGAHNTLLDLEELEDKELDLIRANYLILAKKARAQLRHGHGKGDTGTTAEAAEGPLPAYVPY
jgi:low affinity Fe/Cu permease